MAAREILKWPFIDSSRIAVYGHSGGGAMTLNLLFRYPEIYKTGIAGSLDLINIFMIISILSDTWAATG